MNLKFSSKVMRKMINDPRKPKEGTVCYICKKHSLISELHHVVPIETLAKMFNELDVPIDKISTPIVWLCPNCHAYAHKMLSNTFNTNIGESVLLSYDKQEEIDRLIQLLKTRDKTINELIKHCAKEADK